MPRKARVGGLVVILCVIAWVASFWFVDRGSVGWWMVGAFGVACIVALIKTALSNHVSDRSRSRLRK